jgi:hypothetical protein
MTVLAGHDVEGNIHYVGGQSRRRAARDSDDDGDRSIGNGG